MGLGATFNKALDQVDKYVFGGRIRSNNTIAVYFADQLTDCLDYKSYDEDNGIFYNEDSVGVVFEIVPMLGVDEKTYNLLNSLLSRSVPDNLNLQIMAYSSPKVGAILDRFSNREGAPHPIYNTVGKHRARHFQKGVWNSLSKRSQFHLRYHRVLFAASIRHEDNPNAERDIIEFAENLENFVSQVSGAHLKLKPQDLIRLVSDILNPNTNIRPSDEVYDPVEDINQQIVSPDTQYYVDRRGVRMKTTATPLEMLSPKNKQLFEREEFVARTLECKDFPVHMQFGDMTPSIGDMFAINTRHSSPVLMSLNIYYPNEAESRTAAQMKHIRATNNAASPVAKFMPEMLAKAKDYNYAMEAVTHGARIVKVRFQATVFAQADKIEKAERDTRNLLTSLNYDMRPSDMAHFPALMLSLPMGLGSSFGKGFRNMGRLKTRLSTMLPHAAPIFGEYLGTANPVLMMVGRCGQPYLYDNFSNVGAGNHNLLVTAESGGGKSVLLNETVLGTCANGGHAIIFDDGYSFKNHCILTGGKHYRFSLNDDFGLNVFDMVDYNKAARDDEYRSMCIEMCKSVIIQMVFGKEIPTKEESAILEEAILSVMDRFEGKGTINYVRDYLAAMDDTKLNSNTQSMAKAISTYCTGGVFGKFFNHRNTLDVTSHMTVFELSPLEQKPDLRAVILTALLFMTDQKIVSDVSRRDLVVLDEAHKHIGNVNVCDVLQGWARRVRKYNAALVLATQSASDFDISPDARAIFENCGWKIVLMTSTAGVAAADDMRVFPDEYSKRCARNIDVSKGEYSEAVIIGGGSYSMGRLVLDPFTISLFTTTAEDVAKINRLQEQGRTLEEALYEVSGVEPLRSEEELLEATE